jgi:hypothetical protein
MRRIGKINQYHSSKTNNYLSENKGTMAGGAYYQREISFSNDI